MGMKISNLLITVAVIVGGVVLIAVGILRSDWNYYQTIEQVRQSPPSGAKAVRIVGEIAKGSWAAGPGVGNFSFILTDGSRTLPVRYTGPAVSGTPGRQIVVEGFLGTDGTFMAGKLLTKCESKYSVKPETPTKSRGG
jgi:cytochrome c-type biogenesis protein CcmE